MLTEEATWYDADGVPWQWPSELLRGMQGRGVPPVQIEADPAPGRDGDVVRSIRYGARRLTVPTIIGPDLPEWVRIQVRMWAQHMRTNQASGTLRIDTLLGDSRQIACRYAGGLELVEEVAWAQPATIDLYAPDPFWEDIDEQSVVFTVGGVSNWFPVFPLALTPSEITSGAMVTNTGDDVAWPIVRVTGPATSVTFSNDTTGKSWVFNAALTAGQVLTVDSRPGRKSVMRENGANLFGSLTALSDLWGLVRGANTIRATIPGSSSATAMVVGWRRRWLSV